MYFYATFEWPFNPEVNGFVLLVVVILHLLEPYLNLTTECRRGFRSCSLKMSKLLFLLELVASSQVNPQVAYCSVSCIFSRRLLLNVNMMAQPVKNLPAMLEIWV